VITSEKRVQVRDVLVVPDWKIQKSGFCGLGSPSGLSRKSHAVLKLGTRVCLV
jgi:hypothetical protein